MRKFYLLLTILLIALCIFGTVFAESGELAESGDNTMYLYTNESGELVESGDYEYEDATLIDDYEDYENLYNDEIQSQDELKSAFDEQKTLIVHLEDISHDNSKLVITEILSDIKSEYTTDYYYYYMIKYQIAKVRDEDGTETSAVIVLSYDVSDDKNIKPLKTGDTVYGYIEYISSDDETYNIVNHGLTDDTIALVSISEQDRSLGIVLLTTLAIVLLLIYAGKNGTKLLIPIFVALDLLFIVLVPELELGVNVLLLAVLVALELIVLITVLKNGWNRKSVVAMLSSIIVVALVTALGLLFAYTNGISGKGLITEEAYDLTTNVYYIDSLIKSTIDINMLYASIIIIIASVVSATIASKLTDLCEKYAGSKDMTNNIIEEAKNQICEYPMIITIIFFAMSLPKYMAILYNHTPFVEIINSEILVTDISILLITLISALITSPIVAIMGNLFMGNVEIKQIDDKKE